MLMLPMRDGQTTTSEDRATQLLICEPLSLAKIKMKRLRLWSFKNSGFFSKGSSAPSSWSSSDRGPLSFQLSWTAKHEIVTMNINITVDVIICIIIIISIVIIDHHQHHHLQQRQKSEDVQTDLPNGDQI